MSSLPGAPAVTSLRTLAAALVGAPVLMLAVALVVLPTDWGRTPDLALAAGVVGLVLLGLVAAETLGYRAEPLAPGDPDALATSLARLQQLMMVRLALTEAPVIVALAVSFAFDDGAWPMVVGAAVGLPVLALEVWPTRRSVRKVADRLESAGARSGLPEAFGHA